MAEQEAKLADSYRQPKRPKGRFRTSEGDIDFMGLRFWFIGLSTLLAVISFIALFYPGPKLGTDFVGGTEVEVAFDKPVAAGRIRSSVAKLGFADPEVVEVSSGQLKNHFMIRVKEVSAFSAGQERDLEKALCFEREGEEQKLDEHACPPALRTAEVSFSPGGEKVSVRYKQDVRAQKVEQKTTEGGDVWVPGKDVAAQLDKERLSALGLALGGVELATDRVNPVVQNVRDNRVEFFFKSKGDQIMDGLRAALGQDTVPDKALRIEWVGPKAGKQLRDAAITSVTLAIIFIMVYIAFRFDFRFAPGGVVSLLHDVFISLGAMIVARREVTLSTVAALLTILGYSINDTVVVYDRIRENLGKHRNMSFPKLINRSITEMLGRTLKTSATVAISLVPFLIWGTGTIKDFAFALLCGIIVGTYSSIYVAAPLTEYLDRKFFARIGGKPNKKRITRGGGKTSPNAPARAGAAA